MSAQHLVRIRDSKAEDHNFIKSTWLKAYKNNSKFGEYLTKTTFYDFHPEIIENILKRSRRLVAFPVNEPDVIAGYVIYEKGIIHFCYVKMSMRKFGIGKVLLGATELDINMTMYTHRTEDCDWIHGKWDYTSEGREWVNGKYPGLIHNPYAL